MGSQVRGQAGREKDGNHGCGQADRLAGGDKLQHAIG